MRSNQRKLTRFVAVATLLLMGGVVLAGCDGGILDSEDEDIVVPEQLEGPAAVQTRINGILFDFREAYDFHALYTGLISDEYIHVGSFPGRSNVDSRRPQPGDLSPQQDWFTPLATTQKTTDELVASFESNLDNPEFSNVREQLLDGIALGHFLRGYNLLFWGEAYCQSILDQQGETAPKTPAQRIEEDAIPALEAAIPAAQAASGGGLDLAAEPNNVVAAARVGLARAHMFLGNYGQAESFASQVPDGHSFVIDYSTNTQDEANSVFGITHGQEGFALRISVGGGEADNSPGGERYPYFDEFLGQELITPNSETDLDPQQAGPVNLQLLYDEGADPIVVTSAWEAEMIEAEVQWRDGDVGGAETRINDLLDGDLGIQNPLTIVESDLQLGEWRDVTLNGDAANDLNEIGFARAAGLWQSGQRQAFLRRVFRNDGVNMWPGRGGQAMSFPLYSQELENNENVSSGCPGGDTPGAG